MGAATPRQPGRSVKDQVSSYDTSSSYTDSSEPLPPLLARAAESDPRLTRLDLCFNKQFMVLSGQQKLQALEQLALGKALESVRLDGLGLDNTHGATLARLLRHDGNNDGGVRTLSLQSNSLGEPALLALAKAVSGHPSISELAVCHRGLEPQSSRPQTLQVCCSQVCASPWTGRQPAGRDVDSGGLDASRRDGGRAQAHETQAGPGAGRGAKATPPAVDHGGGRAGAQGARRQPGAQAAGELAGAQAAGELAGHQAAGGGGGEQAALRPDEGEGLPHPEILIMALLTMAGYACYGCTYTVGYTCYGWLCLLWLYVLWLYLLWLFAQQERTSSISRVMDTVLATVAATCDWAEEARRIAQDEVILTPDPDPDPSPSPNPNPEPKPTFP
jgi:hypothetical protein